LESLDFDKGFDILLEIRRINHRNIAQPASGCFGGVTAALWRLN
jgi:hypothetical protein